MAETQKVTLTLSDRLHPRVALLHAQLEAVRADLKALAGQLEPAALDQAPVPGFFSPAGLLGHIAEVESWWMQVVIEGQGDAGDPRRLSRGWCAPFAEEEGGEPVVGKRPLADYLALLDRVRAHSFEHLVTVGAQDLSRDYPYQSTSGPSYEFSLEWVLQHLVEHEAHHRGQLALMKRLLAPR